MRKGSLVRSIVFQTSIQRGCQRPSGISATDSKNSLSSGRHRPLVPPVLDLLEDAAAASPLLSFVVLDFLHLCETRTRTCSRGGTLTISSALSSLMREPRDDDLISSCFPYLPPVKFFIPLINHSVTLGMADIFNCIFANRRDLSIPAEDQIKRTNNPSKKLFLPGTFIQRSEANQM